MNSARVLICTINLGILFVFLVMWSQSALSGWATLSIESGDRAALMVVLPRRVRVAWFCKASETQFLQTECNVYRNKSSIRSESFDTWALDWHSQGPAPFRSLVAEAGCPAWFLVTLFALPVSFCLLDMARSWRRRRHGLCIRCAYDLRGCVELRCPECGTPFRTSVNSVSSDPEDHRSDQRNCLNSPKNPFPAAARPNLESKR
jgi:hypothetical protein